MVSKYPNYLIKNYSIHRFRIQKSCLLVKNINHSIGHEYVIIILNKSIGVFVYRNIEPESKSFYYVIEIKIIKT